jgi:hypothetical protein
MPEPINFRYIVLALLAIIVMSIGFGIAYGGCVGAAKWTQHLFDQENR